MKLFGSLKELISVVFRKDSQEVTLRPNQATTYTAARDVQLPPGDSAHVLTSTSSTQTLTNKSIDADANTITNIDNNDIKAGAGIVYSKLSIADGDLTIAKTSGLQTALDAKVDENAPITGATKTKITYDAKGLVTAGADLAETDLPTGINANKLADGSVDNTEFQRLGTAGTAGAGNLVTTDGTQTLTGKTISALSNTISDLTKADVGLGNVDNTSDATKNAAAVTLTNKTIASPTVTGTLLLQNPSGAQPELHMSEDPDNGTNKVIIKAPAALTADYTLTLPVDDGTSGQILSTDGNGVLSWANNASYTAPSSQILYSGGTGHGSTATTVRRLTTLTTSTGTALTGASDATNGTQVTVNENGIYAIFYNDQRNASKSFMGITVNAASLTTPVQSLPADVIQGVITNVAAGEPGLVVTTLVLNNGDVLRPMTDGGMNETDARVVKFRVVQLVKL